MEKVSMRAFLFFEFGCCQGTYFEIYYGVPSDYPMRTREMPTLRLIDDGTLDTVFECQECGCTCRFYSVERTPEGEITSDGYTYARECHVEECEEFSE